MHLETLAEIPLLCPRCHCRAHEPTHRRRGPNGFKRQARALSLTQADTNPSGDARQASEEVLWGVLTCPECNVEYPIVDGIPILHCNMQDYCNSWAVAISEGPMPMRVAAVVNSYGPDGGNLNGITEDVSIYMDASWGDRVDPPADGPIPGNPSGPFGERILARASDRVARAIELGTGLGRALGELSRGADHVVGVDLNLAFLRRARRLLVGEAVPFLRRMAGHYYSEAIARAGDLAAPRTMLICADALNPPLAPGSFGRVVAGNLLDKVSSPSELFATMDELAAPGGELIVTSPIAWDRRVTRDSERLGRHDPASAITQRFKRGIGLSGPYAIEEEADISWWLRADSRVAASYKNYYLRARKGA